MTRSSTSPIHRPRAGRPRRGFTLVELLVVMAILGLLIALLLPAINSAVRTSRTSSVSAEINQLTQALAQFKSQYGVYPPSRIILSETGDYTPATCQTSVAGGLTATAAAALGQRSVSFLRRIWPRMVLSTSGPVVNGTTKYYDFTGTGPTTAPTVHMLQGAECLVFFLGGIPQPNDTGGYAVVGFAKDPTNPMRNAITTSNRSSPMFEFRPGRLVDLDGNGFPEYLDGLGGSTPRPFVYFSAYEGQGYDPDDNNYLDADDLGVYPDGVFGGFSTPNAPSGRRNFNASTRPDIVASEAPNPYTSEFPLPLNSSGNIDATNHKPREYINKNTYQILSAGFDNNFGIGGSFVTDTTLSPLPFPQAANEQATTQTLEATIRGRERDNLTNFKNGTLE